MLYFTFINLHDRPDQEIIDIASVTDWSLTDNQDQGSTHQNRLVLEPGGTWIPDQDLFFGDEKNRPKPRIQEDEIIEKTDAEIETSGLVSQNFN